MLAKHRPTIVVEYSEGTSKDAGYSRQQILDLLKGLNYRLFGLSEDNKTLSLINLDKKDHSEVSNVIAVHDKGLIKWLQKQ